MSCHNTSTSEKGQSLLNTPQDHSIAYKML